MSVSLRNGNGRLVVLPAAATSVVLAVWLAVALLLFVRRLQGGLTQPLSTLGLVTTGLGVLGLSTVCRRLTLRAWSNREPAAGRWAVTAGSLLIALAFSLPNSSPWGLLLMWALVLSGERRLFRAWGPEADLGGMPTTTSSGVGSTAGFQLPPRPTSSNDLPPGASAATQGGDGQESLASVPGEDAQRPESDDSMLQEMRRSKNAEGAESVCGSVVVEFPVGIRHKACHVSFCPPLATVPEIEVDVESEVTATAKLAQAFTYGARIDVVLNENSTRREEVMLEYYAFTR